VETQVRFLVSPCRICGGQSGIGTGFSPSSSALPNPFYSTGAALQVYEWKPTSTRPHGRPKLRWENDIKNDLKEMKLNDWRICIQDRNKWESIVEKAKNFST
jgi:hypothetical protein